MTTAMKVGSEQGSKGKIFPVVSSLKPTQENQLLASGADALVPRSSDKSCF